MYLYISVGQSSDASTGSGGGTIKLAAVATAPNGEKVDPGYRAREVKVGVISSS